MSTHDAPAQEILIALVNATPGRDEEFKKWYADTHIPEVLQLPGFVSAQRYEVPEVLRAQLPYRYATLYVIEGSGVEALQSLYAGGLGSSDSIDTDNMIMSAFASLGELLTT